MSRLVSILALALCLTAGAQAAEVPAASEPKPARPAPSAPARGPAPASARESLRAPARPPGPDSSRSIRFVQPGTQAVRGPDEGAPRGVPDPLASPFVNPLAAPPEALPVAKVLITVRAIAATRAPEDARLEIDGRLEPIDRDLRTFAGQFSYKGYRLVDEQTFALDFQTPGTMDLPGGRSLRVEPLRLGGDGRIQVRLQLLGQRPQGQAQLHTDYSIGRGRTILVGAYNVTPGKPEQGTLLIAITQGLQGQ